KVNGTDNAIEENLILGFEITPVGIFFESGVGGNVYSNNRASGHHISGWVNPVGNTDGGGNIQF
ncbi:MAG: hypothetical protein SVW57_00205, partial [Thermodesulfobacteriota bacterium]|nr:hypothetical protein [Thermodesulfobacteriota bacterium]